MLKADTKSSNLIKSFFHFAETKELKTTWYTGGPVPSHYSDSHPQYHGLHYFKMFSFVGAQEVLEPETMHHSKIWDM